MRLQLTVVTLTRANVDLCFPGTSEVNGRQPLMSIDIRTRTKRRRTNIFFYLIWLTLAIFSPGSQSFWCVQDEARPTCCISPVLFLALWNSLLSQVQGPARLVTFSCWWRRLYRQMSAVCVCGQFCFIFYRGENVFHNAVSFCSQCEGARLVQECVSEVSVCVDLIVQGCAVRLVRKWSGFAWLATDFSI